MLDHATGLGNLQVFYSMEQLLYQMIINSMY